MGHQSREHMATRLPIILHVINVSVFLLDALFHLVISAEMNVGIHRVQLPVHVAYFLLCEAKLSTVDKDGLC